MGLIVFAAIILILFLGLVFSGIFGSTISIGVALAFFIIGLLMILGTVLYSNRKSYIDLTKLRVKNTNLLEAGSQE
jgi:hypothetical protein